LILFAFAQTVLSGLRHSIKDHEKQADSLSYCLFNILAACVVEKAVPEWYREESPLVMLSGSIHMVFWGMEK